MGLTAGRGYGAEGINKTSFRAKDIQEMLKVTRQRYSYISSQIGIVPEEREVIGRGSYHKFSLKNAVQFAFAHRLSTLGLAPAAVRFILDHINKVDERHGLGIYDPSVELDYRLNIYNEVNPPLLFFHGKHPKHILKKLKEEIEPYEDVHGDGKEPWEDPFQEGKLIDPPSPEEYVEYKLKLKMWDLDEKISYVGEPIFEGPYEMAPGQWDYHVHERELYTLYEDLEGYMVLNLGAIRSKVFGYASR
jgi:hypothetical protein